MDIINVDDLAKKIAKEVSAAELYPIDEINQALNESKLDFEKEYQKPDALLEMVEDYGKKKVVLTSGNISTTIGGAKSKKTFFSTMLIASLLGCIDFAISGNLRGMSVVLFDTEQSFYHVQKISKRLKSLLKGVIQEVEIYALREYMPEKRAAMVEHYLKINRGRYRFVLIDGIVDLLYDFNDLRESKQLSTKVMEWSAKYDCHINMVLHTNKDQNYARGHLGSELMNKSETVFRITKIDDNISSVNCEMSRNEGFKEFQFNINEGIPRRIDFPMGFYNNNPTGHTPVDLIIDNQKGLSAIYENDDIPF